MYEELVKELRKESCGAKTTSWWRAADAIEELSAAVAGFEATTDVEFVKENWHERIRFVPKWIPVTERCPEKSGDYLVFDDCRNLYVNEWHFLLKKWQYDDGRITHWMPLPTPPKEETE